MSKKSIILVALVMLLVGIAAFILNQKEALIEGFKEGRQFKKDQEAGR